jgi:hypothetical protein
MAGRVQRDNRVKPYDPSFQEDLVLWDVDSGTCRVLRDDVALRLQFRSFGHQGDVRRLVVVRKDGSDVWPLPGPLKMPPVVPQRGPGFRQTLPPPPAPKPADPALVLGQAPVVGFTPVAAAFDDAIGSHRLFVEYGDFVTLWDTAKGKALATDFFYGFPSLERNQGP